MPTRSHPVPHSLLPLNGQKEPDGLSVASAALLLPGHHVTVTLGQFNTVWDTALALVCWAIGTQVLAECPRDLDEIKGDSLINSG